MRPAVTPVALVPDVVVDEVVSGVTLPAVGLGEDVVAGAGVWRFISTTVRFLPVPYTWYWTPLRSTITKAWPLRLLCDVFTYIPARGPVRISAYRWPGTACVVSAAFAVEVDE